MFWALLGFELKKLAKAPKNIIACTLLLLVVCGYFPCNFYLNARYDAAQKRITRYDEERRSVSDATRALTLQVAITRSNIAREDEPERQEAYRQELARMESAVAALQKIAAHGLQERYYAGLKGERNRLLELDATINKLQAVLAAREQQIEVGVKLRHVYPSLQDVGNAIKEQIYLREHQLLPIDSPYDITALQCIYRLLRNVLPLLLVLLLAICADSFAAEADSGSYKTLLLQPVSRRSIYLAKALATFCFCTAVLVTALLLLFAVATIIGGVGEPLYPVAIPDKAVAVNDSEASVAVRYIPVIEHIASTVGVVIFFLLFLTAFAAIISANSSTAMTALATAIPVFCAGYAVPLLGAVARFTPFTYATAGAAFQYGSWTAVAVLVTGVAVLVTVGLRLFAKSDVPC